MGRDMTANHFKDLVRQTLFQPGDAARQLIEFSLPRQWLWMAIALVSVLGSILFSASLQMSPPDAQSAALIPSALRSPILFTVLLFAGFVVFSATLFYVGRWMGGTAEAIDDIFAPLVWFQILRLVVQAIVLLLSFVAPGLVSIIVVVVFVWETYILVCFVDAAHRFGSVLKAAGAVILSTLLIGIALSVIFSFIALTMTEGA